MDDTRPDAMTDEPCTEAQNHAPTVAGWCALCGLWLYPNTPEPPAAGYA